MVAAVPLQLLNIFGGIIAGIWLAILGQWSIIGYGLLILIGCLFVEFILALVMIPGLLFVLPASALHKKGYKLSAYLFEFLLGFYIMTVLTVWCMGILTFFVKQAGSNSLIPILLWSYGIVSIP